MLIHCYPKINISFLQLMNDKVWSNKCWSLMVTIVTESVEEGCGMAARAITNLSTGCNIVDVLE